MSNNELQKFFDGLSSKQDEILEQLNQQSSKKDKWDKFDIWSKFLIALAGFCVAFAGSCFTYRYNQQQSLRAQDQDARDEQAKAQQMKITRVQAVGQLMQYLVGNDEKQKEMALLLAKELTDQRFFEELSRIIPGAGKVAALKEVALSGDEIAKQEARKGLAIIASGERKEDNKLAGTALESITPPDSLYTGIKGESIKIEVLPEGFEGESDFSATLDGKEIERKGNSFNFILNKEKGQASYLIMTFRFSTNPDARYKVKISGNNTVTHLVSNKGPSQSITIIFKIA